MEETNIFVQWIQDHGITIGGIALGAWLAHRFAMVFIGRLIRNAIKPGPFRDVQEEKQRENTLISIIKGVLGILIWVVAALMIIAELGVEIGPLLAGAGIAGVAVGFGAQYIIRDLLTGLFIILENQYRIGDIVEINGKAGEVEEITLRMTVIRDLDGNAHHFPNGGIEHATNLTKHTSGIHLNVGIGYDSDLDNVERVINRVGKALTEDEEWKDKIIEPPAFARFNNFGDNAIEVKILGKAKPQHQWNVMGEFRKRLKQEFDKEGIVIPYPQQVTHLAKDNK